MSTCVSCEHFTARAASDAVVAPQKEDLNVVGICRRYPPRLTPEKSGTMASRFPNVHRAHSCGEFSGGFPL